MQTIPIFVSFFMGIIIAVYLPMNSSMARNLGSPIAANVPFFLVGFLTSLLVLLTSGDYRTIIRVKDVPSHLFVPGFLAAFMILGTTIIIPKIGARKFFVLAIAGQILMAMFMSQYGILESPKDPVTVKKVIGAVLLLAGAALSTL